MLKGLGLAFLSVLLAAIVAAICGWANSDFVRVYATQNSVEVMATILALNVATATFLVSSLLNIEDRAGTVVFDGARNEIKQSIYSMIGAFLVNIIVVAAINGSSSRIIPATSISINSLLSLLSLATLFFYLYLLYEIISASLKIKINSSKNK